MSEHESTPSNAHPPLPVVTDEAGDTPVWLPISGVAFFVVMALFTLWRSAHPAPETVDGEVAVEVVE